MAAGTNNPEDEETEPGTEDTIYNPFITNTEVNRTSNIDDESGPDLTPETDEDNHRNSIYAAEEDPDDHGSQ